ncbi:MAG: nitroreductase family deazaflavin-dependent oxidoreductase [Chloroflexota bacterium]|jgi:deazaflavin-dependent oxidoreductase (nitroreductase family)
MTARMQLAARAPRWVTIFGPIARFLLEAKVPLGFNGLITIPGRKTGVPRTTPVAIIVDGSGRRWVWAPWGDVQWVRNLRAAGRATITVRGRTEEVTAVEQDRAQRVTFFRDIMTPIARRMPLGMTFIRVVDGTDLADPVAAADGRPVFELRTR